MSDIVNLNEANDNENDNLIEKLFPKCRPRASKSNIDTNNGVLIDFGNISNDWTSNDFDIDLSPMNVSSDKVRKLDNLKSSHQNNINTTENDDFIHLSGSELHSISNCNLQSELVCSSFSEVRTNPFDIDPIEDLKNGCENKIGFPIKIQSHQIGNCLKPNLNNQEPVDTKNLFCNEKARYDSFECTSNVGHFINPEFISQAIIEAKPNSIFPNEGFFMKSNSLDNFESKSTMSFSPLIGTCKRPMSLPVSPTRPYPGIAVSSSQQLTCKSSCSKKEDKSNGIARVIGNVPIAKYEESPRRYGPKPPGYSQRVICNLNTFGLDKHVEKISSLLPELSCNTDSITSNECPHVIPYKCISDEYKSEFKFDAVKLNNNSKQSDSLIEFSNEQSSQQACHVSKQDQCTPCLSSSPNHENVLKHEEFNSGKIKLNLKDILSPDVTNCESSVIDSQFSDNFFLGRGYNKMPVLEDGLSSGIPSSDNEIDDDSDIEVQLNLDFVPQINSDEKKICDSRLVKKRQAFEDNALQQCDLLSYNTDLSYKLDSNSAKVERNSPLNDQTNDDNDAHFQESNSRLYMNQKVGENDVSQIKNKFSFNQNGNKEIRVSRMEHCDLRIKKKVGNAYEGPDEDCDTDQETDKLLGAQRIEDSKIHHNEKINSSIRKKAKEVPMYGKSVLIEGVLFRARYLGSTQLICEGQPTKAIRMMQAEEAVSRIKAPEGETQPSTDVDLFISTEKIMVLNTDLEEILMDHALRTISYIADIGDLLVLMTRKRVSTLNEEENEPKMKRMPRMICHVFESEEAQFIAKSIGQAFQVAYREFLKANGIEDSSFLKEMDYQEVLNSQEILGNELEMFAKMDRQKEVIVPKQKGEILGMVIVESGWGSMLPTVVIASMAQQSPAARCGQLNIGDQIIAINGISLVGLPLYTCQHYVKNTKSQTAVKLTVVPCAPVVEVKIKRPVTKFQLGFSVQNGVICSLLRGGIAERGGVRVGHRIIEINSQSVVAVPHDRIVNLLATSVGEITMKTMPTSMFRLLTGQESPVFI